MLVFLLKVIFPSKPYIGTMYPKCGDEGKILRIFEKFVKPSEKLLEFEHLTLFRMTHRHPFLVISW
ncbi:hypothetical protein Hanom_Chr08g00737781 [Helianthus anomalus]